MSATEIIEQIDRLEPAEKQKVLSHLMQTAFASPEARQLVGALISHLPPETECDKVRPEFRDTATRVFARNEELFRKLAQ